ncbi:hypothetical protein ACUODF_49895 [Escherichia coli]
MKKLALILFMGTLVSFYADAGRKPCSGSKGGISHCTAGGKFVCNEWLNWLTRMTKNSGKQHAIS